MRSFALAFALLSSCANYGPDAPLFEAARAGDVDKIRSLVAQGANPNQRDNAVNNWTPLLHAVHKHQLGSVAALIDLGANPNGTDPNGTTALMMAAGYGQTDMVQLLLRRGANPRLEGPDGVRAIDLAVAGVPDIDAFTLFRCQEETVDVLRAADPTVHINAKAAMWSRAKRCR